MTFLWWHWVVLGLILIAAEMAASGGFYIIFFGIGALVVGGLVGFNIVGPEWVQLLLFSAISILSLVLFRSRLLRALQQDPQRPPVDALVGEVGTAVETLGPGVVGRIELRGTSWSGRNDGAATVVEGARVRVIRVEGLLLHVEAEGVR